MKRRVGVFLLLVALASACTSTHDERSADVSPSVSQEPEKTFSAKTWQRLPDVPLSPRDSPLVVRVANSVVVVGGTVPMVCPPGVIGCPIPRTAPGGAVFDLDTRTWRRMAAPPTDLAVGTPAGVDGDHLVVLGNRFPDHLFVYDAGANRWTRMPQSPGLLSGDDYLTVGNGIAYVNPGDDRRGEPPIQRLNLATHHWSTLPRSPHRPRLGLRRLFVTPRGLLVMGAAAQGPSGSHIRAMAEVFAQGHWTRLPGPKFQAVGWDWHWTGHRMVAPFPYAERGHGLTLMVGTGRWGRLHNQPNLNKGGWQLNPAATGELALEYGYVYDDASQRWTVLHPPPTARKRSGSVTWVGHDLIAVDDHSYVWLLPDVT
jgi:hypothetical protein